MTTTFCAYPWDLIGDAQSTKRVLAAGADGVAIAAAYHSVRAATPLHPAHRIVDARSAALYVETRAESWGRLRPTSAAAWTGENAFGRAADIARADGLRVEAWIVLTHSTWVGSRNLESCVTNAFGEVYPYALCPTQARVRAYAARLVSETVAAQPLDGVMLEACGPMGVGHLGHHEKTAGADWSPVVEALLSICFCTACTAALREHDADPEALRALIRSRIDGDSSLDGLEVVLAIRAHARRLLLAQCVDVARAAGVTRIVVHAQPDPWATGPFAALLDEADLVDGIVLPGNLAHDVGGLDELRSRIGSARLGGYLSALPPTTIDDIRHMWPITMGALDDTYVYHLGLLGRERLNAVGNAMQR